MENPTPDVLSALLGFLEEGFVFWLAVLRTLGDLSCSVRAMGSTNTWLKKVREDWRLGYMFFGANLKSDPATDTRRLLA